MQKHLWSVALLIATSLMTQVMAAESVQFQNIRVGGLGCPSETTQIVLAPDQSSASIIFGQFEARVPQTVTSPKVNPNIAIINCNIFVDVKLPQGLKLEALDLHYDMRGLTTLDPGVRGNFKSTLVEKNGLGILHSRSPELLTEKSWNQTGALQDDDFIISTSKRLPLASACAMGQVSDVVTLRLQNSLTAQILSGFENRAQGLVVMDSSDLRGGLKLSALVSNCRPIAGTPPGSGGGGRNCRIVVVGGRTVQVCR